jgi:hypothetical protein
MGKFTLTDDRTEVTAVTLHAGGTKRLHLAGVGADLKKLSVDSSNPAVVTAKVVALFNGPKGIWTVDLSAKAKGSADVKATLGGNPAAALAVTVAEKLELPAASSEEGLLARLLLAESINPGMPGYDAAKSRTGMQWMRVVLANRLKDPGSFGAKGATTVREVVTAPGQFAGFEKYPALGSKQEKVITAVLATANDDSDARQEKYARFVRDALEVAQSKSVIADPCPTGLYGWRTVGHGSPGKGFAAYGGPLSGNQFYTLGKE